MKTISVLAAATLAVANADEYFTGDGTAYTLGQASAGNCNMMSALNIATSDYAALNDKQWDGLKNCGRCAEVSCADDRCADQSKSIVVQLLDRCPECAHGDLDLSPTVFTALTGSTPSRYTIKWKFVDCPVSGNVNYCLKGGSNNYWTAVQPTNVATGVKSLQINGQDTTMLGSAYYYLLDGASEAQTDLTSVTISMTDVNGNSIEDTVSLTADSCTEGANQFPNGGGSSQTTQQSTPTSTNPTPTTAAPTTSPTQAPTPSPTPSPTPTPYETPAPTTQTPSPTTESASASGDDARQTTQQLLNVTATLIPEITKKPTKVASSSSDSGTSSDDSTQQQQTEQQTQQVSPAATTAVPSTNTNQTAESQAAGDDAQKANTKSQEGSNGTDGWIIGLTTLGGVGVVALIVVVVISKKKSIQEEKARDMEAPSMMSVQSFDVQNTPDRRQAFGLL